MDNVRQGGEPTPDPVTKTGELIDHLTHAALARHTAGLSPNTVIGAWFDWATHLALSPGKQMQVADKAARKMQRFGRHALHCATARDGAAPCIEPLAQDDRFRDPAWQTRPFNLIQQGFLLQQQLWHNAVSGVPGVTAQHERQLQFLTRQLLDVVSPSNFPITNPEILNRTRAEAGLNLLRGALNLAEDVTRKLAGSPPAGVAQFRVGHEVAATPGKVVFRNRLIELIQYAPTTAAVRPEPVLIVPAWIMKYYILDLSPQNSLVRHLVSQGFTVFMISWKNPGPEDRDLSMEDYRQLGVMAALGAVGAVVPDQKVHAVGYCLGGTLLSIAAAALARGGREALASLTLLASQTDFSEPGELQLFINESQLAYLDDMMWDEGYLDSAHMAGAFQMLKSNDLVWSRMMRDYFMGDRAPMTDLVAWNADGTRMPYRMHSEYLHALYLNNDLSAGRFRVEGAPVALSDIRAPIFAVGTLKDHVAPWRSVFRIHMLTDTGVTFVLTSGGHNAGIVSEPGHRGRHYQIRTVDHLDRHIDPDHWAAETPQQEGSWWEAWVDWLVTHSAVPVPAPQIGNAAAGYAPIADAPGAYVLAH